MLLNPNNADNNMSLWAQTVSKKLEQNAQTQYTEGMQAFSRVIHGTVRGYISTIILLKEGMRALSPQPLRFRWGSGHATCGTLKRKLFDKSCRSHPVNFFLLTSRFTCLINQRITNTLVTKSVQNTVCSYP